MVAVWCLSCLCRARFRRLCLCVPMSQVHLIEVREAVVEHREKVLRRVTAGSGFCMSWLLHELAFA